MVATGLRKKGSTPAKKATFKFTVDCQQPAEDTIIEPKDFEKFLANKIKVDGKTGNLGEKVSIKREKAKVHVTAEAPFSKRYLKYLGKKYLKAQQLRDFLRIVAPSRSSYEMRYFNINDEKNEEEKKRPRISEESGLELGPCLLQIHAETLKFTVDCQQPAEDTIIEPKDACCIARDEGSFWENARGCPTWVKDFEKFLANKIKVDGKTGNLGEKVSIHREKAKVHVTAEAPFSKRYLPLCQQLRLGGPPMSSDKGGLAPHLVLQICLNPEFGQSQQLRDFLRIVAPSKTSYEMRLLSNINDDKGEGERH
ncbi:rpl22 [Symbiodinium sp. CCMP2456]|nr:rpl22 [Symbiodinium sp. CCMP2456]